MNIHELEVFASAYEAGSFAATAESLFMTRQAASKAVAQLESELGPLFRRGARGIEPTELARTIFPIAQRMLRDRDQILADAQTYAAGHMGSLTLALEPGALLTLPPRSGGTLPRGVSASEPHRRASSHPRCPTPPARRPGQRRHSRAASPRRSRLYTARLDRACNRLLGRALRARTPCAGCLCPWRGAGLATRVARRSGHPWGRPQQPCGAGASPLPGQPRYRGSADLRLRRFHARSVRDAAGNRRHHRRETGGLEAVRPRVHGARAVARRRPTLDGRGQPPACIQSGRDGSGLCGVRGGEGRRG